MEEYPKHHFPSPLPAPHLYQLQTPYPIFNDQLTSIGKGRNECGLMMGGKGGIGLDGDFDHFDLCDPILTQFPSSHDPPSGQDIDYHMDVVCGW